jgi:hypothetical protein
MMGVALPVFLIFGGVACFAFTFATRGLAAVLQFYAVFTLPLLCWSYFFGPQKGRMIHFWVIVTYFLFGLLTLLNARSAINDGTYDALMMIVFSALAYGAVRNVRDIYSDYRQGIKRDFFKK